jgi:hypothetical protein
LEFKIGEGIAFARRLFSRLKSDTLKAGGMAYALVDAVYVPLLVWRVRREAFQRLKWPLAIAAAFVWYGIWAWAIGNFWETVYRYVFPGWAQIWVPIIAIVIAFVVSLGLWSLALRFKGNPVLIFCLLGGMLGSLTHIWAVYRGIVTKPPMLQGASALAAVIIAFFEYMFYWCTILLIAKLIDWGRSRFGHPVS